MADLLLLPYPQSLALFPQGPITPGPLTQQIDPTALDQPQSYRLTITAEQTLLVAHDAAGLFYGQQTLQQIQAQADDAGRVPSLTIRDWPDLPVRGVMLDISRNRVPTMRTLFALVDKLASWKINHLQLYTEHTFAYAGHETVWQDASPMTPDEVRELDAYCRARHIELAANQNSFGHMTRWLMHEPYRALACCPDGFEHPYSGHKPFPFTLNPADPRCPGLLADLYGQLLPCFQSSIVNVGCDETFDLGQGQSQAACEARGIGRVYLDFLLQVHELIQARGSRMQFWGDIVLQHPALAGELPEDVVALHWGYEADQPTAEGFAKFAEAGVACWACPGTSSWNTFGGRTTNMLQNLKHAAEHAIQHACGGYLITDWGDNGHLQPMTVSLPGFAYGAGVSWCITQNHDPFDLAARLDRFAFDGESIGAAALALGEVYTHAGRLMSNQSALFDLWLRPNDCGNSEAFNGITSETLDTCRAEIHNTWTGLGAGPHAEALRWAGGMMDHVCVQALHRLAHADTPLCALPETTRRALAETLHPLRETFEQQWHQTSRPGGLKASSAWVDWILSHYAGQPTAKPWSF